MDNPYSALNLDDLPKGKLPDHLELQKTRVVCQADAPIYTEPVNYSGAYMAYGVDNSLSFEEFRKSFRVEVIALNEDEIEFDIVGIDASLANAFRRILIAEVPTMAIEKVYIANNTSIIQDEVLAHRLGLVPIKADPRHFEFKEDEEVASEKNTIVFKLNTVCTRQGERVKNASVKSDELKWLPQGSEMPFDTNTKFTAFGCSQDSLPAFTHGPIGPRYKDIILAKLRPGQVSVSELCTIPAPAAYYSSAMEETEVVAIELEAHAVKGIGKTHAKWSPVATARYRMLPEVELKEEFRGDMAEQLVRKCPVHVFDIEDLGKGQKRAVVARPRDCTLCRECIMDEDWDKKIQLRRVREHFIFTIESTGALPPEVLFTEAIKILVEKCQRIFTELS